MTIDKILNQPIFIIGAQRSGTTWVQKMLISHPEICGGQETHFFRAFGPAIKTFDGTSRSKRKAGLYFFWKEEKLFEDLFQLWKKTNKKIISSSQNIKYFVEKTPDHSLWIPQIIRLIPKSRFIFIIRDSRSVVCSLVAASKKEWGSRWAPDNIRDAAKQWNYYVKTAYLALSKLPKQQKAFVYYEHLLYNPILQLENLFVSTRS